jgi:hypothetical protein
VSFCVEFGSVTGRGVFVEVAGRVCGIAGADVIIGTSIDEFVEISIEGLVATEVAVVVEPGIGKLDVSVVKLFNGVDAAGVKVEVDAVLAVGFVKCVGGPGLGGGIDNASLLCGNRSSVMAARTLVPDVAAAATTFRLTKKTMTPRSNIFEALRAVSVVTV